MKKFNKLNRDVRPQEQPEGTYPFAKNGIQDYVYGSVFNEPGFMLSNAAIPYTPIGVIETDKFPIIFSTDNVNSAIGYYDTENDVYIAKVDDSVLPFKLKFNTSFFITGQAQRNYKGEMVCAFTDKNDVLYYLNVDNPVLNSLNDIRLFQNALPADISIQEQAGGTLLPGAYYVGIRYTKKDGTETSTVSTSAPTIIGGTAGQVTDKGLLIQLTNIDTDYDGMIVIVISKINGIFTAVQYLNSLSISGSSLTVNYTGAELTESITLEEVLIPRKVYKKVGTMAQLNDSLYIFDLESPLRVKMQQWVNMVRLKWHSKLTTADPVYEPMKNGVEKSHMHGEVYSWYMRFKINDGTVTDAFHIPGEPLLVGDLASSTIASAESITAKKFQVEDRIPLFDVATKSGYFGKWQNETEVYPNTDDYNSTAVGGEDLRGLPVRHHRFPSIRWCKENLYSGEASYGRNALDMLGVSVENLIIPSQYADMIVGYELFYAKRNVANSTVIGQSLLMFGQRNKLETVLNPTNYYSAGGNWSARINYRVTERWPIDLDESIVHMHSFDMLFNKPGVTPDYLDMQLKERRTNIAATGGYIEDQAVSSANDGPIVFNLDYLQKGEAPTLPAKTIKSIQDTQYVPNNIELGKWHNTGIESFFGGRLKHPEHLLDVGEVGLLDVQPHSSRGYTPPENTPNTEATFLTNLMSVRKEMFAPFTGQSLVREASSNSITTPSQVFYRGDVYICDYTFHTYGWWCSTPGTQAEGEFHSMFQGTKVARRFVCECAANLYNRFEDLINVYSKYYPKSPLVPSNPDNYLTNFIRTNDPNQFGYKKDSNALDDLFNSTIYNTFAEDLNLHPYRVHRMGKMSRQTKIRSWRSILPADYYELQKNMGKPVHGEGMDDRLLIHCENALFLTQDKTKLESDIIAVTLGSGDIFQFQPQEAMSAKLGYAGTQHELACVRTPFGYVFIDSKEGQIFNYKGQLELINKELNTFFKDYLRLKEINPFIGNGYTIGFDPKYKRYLLTVKNKHLPAAEPLPAVYNPADIGTYTIGQKLLKDGRIVIFLGINTTVYDCPTTLLPTADDKTITIPEDTAIGTQIGILSGINIVDFYITGVMSPFSLDPSTGKIVVTGSLDFYVASTYGFTGYGVGPSGATDPFTLTINLTEVNRPPVINDKEVTLSDDSIDGTVVTDMVGTDREGGTLAYSITAGNSSGAFAIDSVTGEVTVDDSSVLDGIGVPIYILTIEVSDGTLTSTALLTIRMTHVNRAPRVVNTVFDITDAAATGSTVGIADAAFDAEGDPVTYTLVGASTPGVFSLDTSTLEVKVINNSMLTPATIPSVVLYVTASDGLPGHTVAFTITVNVHFDRGSVLFEPAVPSCSAGTPSCASGYTLSTDGTVCVRTTTTAPTIVSSGCLAASTNAVYGSYFARIYKPGFSNSSIELYTAPAGDVFAEMSAAYWLGKPNDIGVWVDADCSGTKDALTAGQQTTMSFNYGNTGSARTVYVGVFGDNEFELKVNGTSIAKTLNPSAAENFKIMHIFPVDIINGTNIFNLVGTGDGSVSDAMGMMIMDNTPAVIQAATSDGALSILFSSDTMRGASNIIATCPPGYVLDLTGSPVCKMIETAVPSGGTNTRHWDKVSIKDLRHGSALISTVNNQDTPDLFYDGIPVPYYPDIANHIDCGSTVVTYLNIAKSGTAQKNDCTSGVGTVVTYTVPAGTYMSIISQADADSLADADVAANKQVFANLNGHCS